MSIRKAVRKIYNYFFSPMPSLFDLFVCFGIMQIGYLDKSFQGFYLVFYTLLLLALSISYKSTRNYKNIWLSLILLWSFLGIFIHSWIVNTKSITYMYLNFYLMSEGFIYILFGILYLYLIITKCTNVRLLIVTVPLSLIPLYQIQVYCGQMSFLLSMAISIMIYTFRKKMFSLSMSMLIGFLIIFIGNFKWICMKFSCRPIIWNELISVIKKYPIFGTGFNKYLIPDNMMFISQLNNDFEMSWIYRHNDYLSIAGFLGLPILIGIFGYLIYCFNKFKDTWKIIPFMSFVLVCFFQMTMFDPYKAFIVLTVLGYLHIEA